MRTGSGVQQVKASKEAEVKSEGYCQGGRWRAESEKDTNAPGGCFY